MCVCVRMCKLEKKIVRLCYCLLERVRERENERQHVSVCVYVCMRVREASVCGGGGVICVCAFV